MGIFDFLKKSKEDSIQPGMELPPVPEMEGIGGFPELPKTMPTSLPEESLPPLPEMAPQTPKDLPMMNEEADFELPQMPGMPEGLEDMPSPPNTRAQTMQRPQTTPQQTMRMPRPELPTTPEYHHSSDTIPSKIPPLEGIPEPPKEGSAAKKKLHPEYDDELPPLPAETPMTAKAAAYEDEPEESYKEMREKQVRKKLHGPLFIKADSVRDILSNTEDIRESFRGEDDIFFRINEIKSTQDKKYEKLRQNLEDVQRKLIFLDRTLFDRKY